MVYIYIFGAILNFYLIPRFSSVIEFPSLPNNFVFFSGVTDPTSLTLIYVKLW